LGRFLQADPLAGGVFEPQSMNRYAYVNNEPINLVDPLGLDPKKNIPVSNDPFGDAGWTSLTIIVTYGWIPWDGSVSLPGINNPQAGAITGLAYWGITGYSGIGSFYGGGLMGGAAGGGGGGGGNSKDPTKLPKCSDVFWDALKQPVALVNKGMKMLPVVVPALAGAGWGARWIAAQAWAMEAAGRVDPIGGAAYWQGIAESSDALAAGGRAALLRAPTFALGALDAALAYAVAKEAYAAATGQCKR